VPESFRRRPAFQKYLARCRNN